MAGEESDAEIETDGIEPDEAVGFAGVELLVVPTT